MRLFCGIICILFLAQACRETPPKPPEVDADLMTDILVDLHIAEAHLQTVPAEWKDSVNTAMRETIAEIYAITVEEMESKIRDLQANPDLQQLIYERVITRLDSLKETTPASYQRQDM